MKKIVITAGGTSEKIDNVRKITNSSSGKLGMTIANHLLKENEVYKLLGAKTSQNTMKQVDFAFKSFFALAKKKANGNYSKKVKIPKYLEKDGYLRHVVKLKNPHGMECNLFFTMKALSPQEVLASLEGN